MSYTIEHLKLAHKILTNLGEALAVPGSFEPGANRRAEIIAATLSEAEGRVAARDGCGAQRSEHK